MYRIRERYPFMKYLPVGARNLLGMSLVLFVAGHIYYLYLWAPYIERHHLLDSMPRVVGSLDVACDLFYLLLLLFACSKFESIASGCLLMGLAFFSAVAQWSSILLYNPETSDPDDGAARWIWIASAAILFVVTFLRGLKVTEDQPSESASC